jgi:[acyl-carrier-protein] S-malonyltransferase
MFPGQGAQHPGMGKELNDNYAEAAAVFKQADEIAGFELSKLCFEGPAEILNQTEFAQPALLVSSLAVFAVLKKSGILPTLTAGLSLGEYTALLAAEKITLKEALPLVMNRARIMQAAVPAGKGAMAAVIGLKNQTVLEICHEVNGIVDVANYNCPGQLVISGEKPAVEIAVSLLKEQGGRVIPLAVSVPSHCQLMYSAADQLKQYLTQVDWQNSAVEVISNVNARENDIADLPEILASQLYLPVLWEQSIRHMMDKVDYFVEVGPGSTLSSLIKKIDRKILLGNVNNTSTLEQLMEKVKSI